MSAKAEAVIAAWSDRYFKLLSSHGRSFIWWERQSGLVHAWWYYHQGLQDHDTFNATELEIDNWAETSLVTELTLEEFDELCPRSK